MGSLGPADHLDSTHICLIYPGNHQKTSRMDSLEPSIDERPTEVDRKVGEAVHATWTGWREKGSGGAASPPSKAEPPNLACKSRGAGWSVF